MERRKMERKSAMLESKVCVVYSNQGHVEVALSTKSYRFVDKNDLGHTMQICATSRRTEDVSIVVGMGNKLPISVPEPYPFEPGSLDGFGLTRRSMSIRCPRIATNDPLSRWKNPIRPFHRPKPQKRWRRCAAHSLPSSDLGRLRFI